MKQTKFTNFLNRKYTPSMYQTIHKSLAFKYIFTFVLVTSSLFSFAQCSPKVVRTDGTLSTSGTFCEGQIIAFEANSPGYTTTIEWDFGYNSNKSSAEKPTFNYPLAGNYTVTFKGDGFAGQCTETIAITIKPSPDIHFRRLNDSAQCFKNNSFCFKDSSQAPSGLIVRQTYVFSNGLRIDSINPTFPYSFCVDITDPSGGYFDLVIESEDSSGCVSKLIFQDYLYVYPKLGIEFQNITPNPNPNCDSTLGRFKNVSLVPLADVDSFMWVFGDGDSVKGDASTNTEWWNGPANDGIIEHMYRKNGTFDGTLIASAYGCTDTFTFRAAVSNILLEPKILSTPNPACTPDNPISFSVQGLNGANVSSFLWNFGNPPAGPPNLNDKTLTPEFSYGPGPWMISLRLRSGPCDITVYDTVQVIGPGSTIEVPFDRVAEDQAFQCVIEDTVCFPNNSSFYQNDFNRLDEDSIVFYYDYTFERVFDITSGQYTFRYRTWEERPRGNFLLTDSVYANTDTIKQNGYRVYYDATKDSIAAIQGNDTTWHKDFYATAPNLSYRFGVNGRKRFIFNYIPPTGRGGVGTGDQTAIPPAVQFKDFRPNVWRVWDMGDQYAPQCTTDSRPWVNKNVGINCNWVIDSAPCHWYTPWDEVYRTFQEGRNYTQPYRETRIYKPLRECYQVNIYAADTMIVPGDTILTVPIDSSYTYRGVTIPAGVRYPKNKLGNWIVRRPPSIFYGTKFYWDAALDTFVAINNIVDTTYHDEDSLGRNNPLNGKGTTQWTVTYHDMEFTIPTGVTIDIVKLQGPGGGGAGAGGTRTLTGPQTVIIEADEQFTLYSLDSIIPTIYIEENGPDTSYAQPSNYVTEELKFGILVRTVKQAVFVDSAAHREKWFTDRATCFNVSLWQKDTIHPLLCEATGTKSLALIPPNAKGLEWVSGTPCPFDGNNLNYILTFDISETKPGCTQQWFAVNLDTFADPNAFIPFNNGLLAPPPPGLPIPFVLPYAIRGNLGTRFVKGYSPGEIGNPYARNPIGSFALGLIVGNGKPDPNGGPPACLDTFYYPDLFRILPLDASFEIVYPLPISTTPLQYYMCPGDTAYYRIINPIQDSIKTLRWAWGYQGLGKGPNLSIYVEEFQYYQPYKGPRPNRNDKDIVYNGEDWLYNYVVRRNIDDILGEELLDTIVTSIIKDWKIVAIKTNTDQLIKDAFEQLLGLNYSEIPAEDVPYYLGDGTFGCLDTTGISDLFQFGIQVYSDKTKDWGVTRVGDKIYRLDTTVRPFQNIETQHILHFRDSSMQGFDTLMLDTNFDGRKDRLTGLYRHIYKYPVITNPDECNPSVKDTIYRNGSGPMAPSLFLNSTPGCEARSTQLLNVGFYNDFWVRNENLCQGLNLVIEDSLRYYQYGEQDPFTYPIHDFPLWQTRYITNEETYRADWDINDGQFDSTRSIILNHTYTDPGEYTITVVAEDSIGCTDTTFLKAYVSKVIPGFDFGSAIVNCASIINFKDTSTYIDPCAAKDTCSNGTDLSCEKIIAWEWDFGDGTRKSILQNPSHNYTSGGYYDVRLIVTTELGCVDSIIQTIYIPGPQPEFEFDNAVWNINDTAVICVGDLVNLKNTSKGDVNTPKFQIIWGDGSNDPPAGIDSIFGHVYNTPGTYELFLIQEDEIPGTGNRCSRIFPDTNPDLLIQHRIVVIVNPRPDVLITASDTLVCPDDPIVFTGTLDDRYLRLKWLMGYNNDEINEVVPDTTVTYAYPVSGTYQVILAPEYDELPRCWDRDTITVRVVDVKASFDIDSSARPEFCFTNTSTGATSYRWTFEETPPLIDGASEETDPCYNWDERKGTYKVCLTAISSEGCEDDTCQIVSNTFLRRLVPYNVFTPNGSDDFNNEFVIEGESLDEYEIKIFNRWGESVFESSDINKSWNGKVNNTGVECPEGTYFYIINYTFKFGEKNEGLGPIEGSVELIRQ